MSSSSFSCTRRHDFLPITSTASTLSSRSASRRTPSPTIPVAPNSIAFMAVPPRPEVRNAGREELADHASSVREKKVKRVEPGVGERVVQLIGGKPALIVPEIDVRGDEPQDAVIDQRGVDRPEELRDPRQPQAKARGAEPAVAPGRVLLKSPSANRDEFEEPELPPRLSDGLGIGVPGEDLVKESNVPQSRLVFPPPAA